MSNGYSDWWKKAIKDTGDFFTHDTGGSSTGPGQYTDKEQRVAKTWGWLRPNDPETLAKREEAAREQGDTAKSTEFQLKQEYGTDDPAEIAKLKASQALLDYEKDPEKAAGFGRKVQGAQERAFKASRDATAIALRNALNQQVMAGQPVDAGAAQAAFAGATELADEQQAQERATMNEAIRRATFGEGQRLVAELQGAKVPLTPGQQMMNKTGQNASKAAMLFLADMADSQDPTGGGAPTPTESTA